MAAWPKD